MQKPPFCINFVVQPVAYITTLLFARLNLANSNMSVFISVKFVTQELIFSYVLCKFGEYHKQNIAKFFVVICTMVAKLVLELSTKVNKKPPV